MTTDHFAKLHARRDELIAASSEKERALIKRIADTTQRALELRADSDRQARNFHQRQADSLRAEAATLEDIARTLNSRDLPRLRTEQENIRQFRVPELAALMTSANLKARASQDDLKRTTANSLVAARAAFEAHVAQIATKRTLELAQALADAAAAANADPGSVVLALLATKQVA
jgi:hypothetical protein